MFTPSPVRGFEYCCGGVAKNPFKGGPALCRGREGRVPSDAFPSSDDDSSPGAPLDNFDEGKRESSDLDLFFKPLSLGVPGLCRLGVPGLRDGGDK